MPRGTCDVLSCLCCPYFSNGCGHKRSEVSLSWLCHLQWWDSISSLSNDGIPSHHCPVVHPPGMRRRCFFFRSLYTSGPKISSIENAIERFLGLDSLHQLVHTFWTWLLLRSFWSCLRMFKTYQNGWYFKTSKVFFLDFFMLFPQWQSSSFLMTYTSNGREAAN